jgi:hypothetical protein
MIGPEPNGVVAVFPTRFETEAALDWLTLDGVEKRSVSVLGPGEPPVDRPPELDHGARHRREVASYWAGWGAGLGGVLGVGPIAIALAASTVGLGPFAAGVALGLAALATTATVGALGSALVGLGVHEQRARAYEKALAAGKFIVVVHTDDPAALRDAKEEMTTLGAEWVEVHGLPLATA